jgi:uncharacterized paraquat-inducible protein A
MNRSRKKKTKPKRSGEASSLLQYDTEVRCPRCGTPLHVSPEGARIVLHSLKTVGVAGLVCLCGHIQFIGRDLKPMYLTKNER